MNRTVFGRCHYNALSSEFGILAGRSSIIWENVQQDIYVFLGKNTVDFEANFPSRNIPSVAHIS